MKNIHAYIDAANLHNGVAALGWKVDYKKLRRWLGQKYQVSVAYIFIGYLPKRKRQYEQLRADGYELVFKEVVFHSDGKPKANCDADLVLKAAREYFEKGVGEAVLISSDGDYAPLVRFFIEKQGGNARTFSGNLQEVLDFAQEDRCTDRGATRSAQ